MDRNSSKVTARPTATAPGTERLSRRILLNLLLLAAVTGLAIATWHTVRLGYADWLFHRGSPEDGHRAAGLVPGNARYWSGASPPQPAEAVRHNPRDADSWIRLGLAAEMKGDPAEAERCLTQAARVNRTYVPCWTLANFYFRRGDRDKFWLWARRSAEMAYQDQSALFDLCWRISQSPEEILNRAIPERGPVLAQYLRFLLERGRLEAAGAPARLLLARAGPTERDLLLAYCDRLLSAGDTSAAVQTWNVLADKRLIAHAPLRPESGESLTNGRFLSEPMSVAFDWRYPRLEGVSRKRAGTEGGLRIEFSGHQPENCLILEQIVPVARGAGYRLEVEYRTAGIAAGSGLRWIVIDPASGRLLSTAGFDAAGESWVTSGLTFSTPPGADRALLQLAYGRAPGTARIEGTLWLRRVALRLVSKETP